MLALAASLVRTRKAGLAGVFVAVLFGSAVLTACGILADSGMRGGFPPERYAAAAVVVGAPQSLPVPDDVSQPYGERVPVPAGWVRQVERVPGVRTAVGDVSIPVSLVTASGTVLAGTSGKPILAHGWSSAVLGPFTISAGTAPRASGQVVLDTALAARAGVRPGDSIEVAVGSVPARYRVAGLAAPPTGGLPRQSAVFLSDAAALRASGRPGKVDTVGVIADPGVSAGMLANRIADAVPGAVTYTGANRAEAEFLGIGQGRSALIQVATSLGAAMIIVVIFVVAAALGVSIQQRGREMALLRAIAATPRQVRQLIAAEVLVVSTVAAVGGALPGLAVSALMRGAFVAAGMLPSGFSFVIDPVPFIGSVVACVLAAHVAALITARRASRISVVSALAEAAGAPARPGRLRLTVGYLLAAAGVGAAFAAPLAAAGQADTIQASVSGAVILLLIAVALLGPHWLPAIMTLVLPRRGGPRQAARDGAGPGAFLAAASVRARSKRISLAAIPLVMAVALSAVEIFGTTTLVATAQRQADDGLTADYVVTAAGPGLSPRLAGVIQDVPGVSAVTPVARTQVVATYMSAGDLSAASLSAQGVTPAGLDRTMNLAVTSGGMAGLRGDTVALSTSAASTLGAGVGQTVSLRLGDGTPIRPRVVAVYRNGLGYGDVTLPNTMVVDHTTSRLDADILVRTAPGTRAGTVARALGAALARYPGVTVSGRGAFTSAQAGTLARQSQASLILDGILLAYIMIAVVNSLVMATAARAREFALLRLLGATGRQARSMMRREAAVITVAAVVIGSLTALPPLVSISAGMAGSPLPDVPPGYYLAIVAVVAAVGWGSVMIPARLAMRARA